MILHNYFTIRNCSSRGPVVENDVEWRKIDPKLQKVIFLWFSVRCHGNMCNLKVIVLLEFISRDLYLLFAIRFSSKFQYSVFYQHMRPKSGLKFPWPLVGFCQFVLKILSGNEILTSIKGRNSVNILRKMTGNNPKLDLVNDDVHTKFGRIL